MLGEGGPQGCLSRSLSSTCRGYWREQLPLNLSALGTAPSIYTGTVRPAETLHYRLTLPLPPGTRSGRRFVDGAAAWPPIAATDCGPDCGHRLRPLIATLIAATDCAMESDPADERR
jgi:hypothetical protein